MIEQFISLLRRSRLPLDEREIADILWFSRVLPRSPAAPEPVIPEPPVVPDDQPGTRETAPVTTSSAKSEKKAASAGADVFTPASSERSDDQLRASRVRVPGAAALPEAAEISRALRPFTRRFKAGREMALDVDETVQRTAETRFLNPVFRPQPERWFDVALVVEDTPTMAVWQQTIHEFERLLARQGAFRDVRVWQLRFAGERAVVRESSGVQRTPEALCDPAARRLILLLSDCSSRPWRDGALAQVVLKWARRMPVVTIHLLSERLWPHTATGAPQTTVTADLPGRANALLKFDLPWWTEAANNNSVPLPLVALKPEHLKQWAAMLMKPGAIYERAVLLSARPEAAADAAPRAETKLTPDERVQRFRALVSSETFDLAVYLSFMPLTLPVMRLVQAAMLAHPRQEQLAELLLGGIIRRRNPDDQARPAEEAEYEFIDGVREILERAIFRTEIDRVLEAVSNFIEQRTGTPFDFVALLENPEGEETLPATAQPFAHLARSALKRLGISYEPLSSPATATEVDETAQPGSEETPPESAASSLLKENPQLLREALTGHLPPELNEPLRRELFSMLPREVLTVAKEAGIFVSDDTVMISPRPDEFGTNLFFSDEWLIEAYIRNRALISPESLDDYAPQSEVEPLKAQVREYARGTSGGALRLTVSNGRQLALTLLRQLSSEFPGGILLFSLPADAEGQDAIRAAFKACIHPFIPLGEQLFEEYSDLTVDFLKTLWDHRLLIALDNVRDASPFAALQPYGGSVLLLISPAPAAVQPGADQNDPWKGAFGGEAERNQRILTATVSPLTESPDMFALKLTVRSTDPASYPLRGNVQFYLHPTFGADKPVVRADESTSQAVYETRAWGAFTVGAVADEGRTQLELDLSRLPELPIEFRSPLDDLIKRAVTNNLDLAEDELPEFEAYLKALNEARSSGSPARITRALSALGHVLASFHKHAEAIEFYEHALSAALKSGQSSDRAHAEAVWGMLGESQQETGDLTSAQRSFEQSLKLAREFGDLMAESRALKRLAKLSEMFSEVEQALKLYQQALELDRRTGDRAGEAGALQDIGYCFADLGDLRQAIACYEQALRIFRELGKRWEEVSTMTLLASALARLGEYRQALVMAEEILKSGVPLAPRQIEELRREMEVWQSRMQSPHAELPPEDLPM
ncbi:MAG: tetratricopeptide repeat protein [Blastocatellia bacterium]